MKRPAPRRIITTIPAASEIVCALGLVDELVGVSHECRYPAAVQRKPRVTQVNFNYAAASSREIDAHVKANAHRRRSLYRLDEPLLQNLRPTHLIMQKLCEVCAITPSDVQTSLQGLAHPPDLLSLDASALSGIFTDIERLGSWLDRTAAATQLAGDLHRQLDALTRRTRTLRPVTVFCVEWLDPLFATGHWVPEMVELAGGRDAIATASQPSRQTTWSNVLAANPEIIVFMPCGFPLAKTLAELPRLEALPEWPRLRAVQNRQVWVVDGPDYFSQSGPRVLAEGLPLLARLFHPEVFGPPPAQQALNVADRHRASLSAQ